MAADTIRCRVAPGSTYHLVVHDGDNHKRVIAKEGDVITVSSVAFARAGTALRNLEDASKAVDPDPTPAESKEAPKEAPKAESKEAPKEAPKATGTVGKKK